MKKRTRWIVLLIVCIVLAGGALIWSIVRNRQREEYQPPYVLQEVLEEGAKPQETSSGERQDEQDPNTWSVAEAHTKVQEILEKGRSGAYEHLIFSEFEPIVTDEDSMSVLEVELPNRYHDLGAKELAEKELEVLQKFFPEGMDMNRVFDQTVGYETYAKMMERIENGMYGTELNPYLNEVESGIPYLNYNIETEEETIHGQINGGINYTFVCKRNPSVDHYVATYYAQNRDGSLEDTYELEEGTITVQEVKERIERFFNEEFPIPYESESRYRVASVSVGERTDGTLIFTGDARRIYHGVVFESGIDASYGMAEYVDSMSADLFTDGQVLNFTNVMNEQITQMGDPIRRILSLDWALTAIGERLAENTDYTVEGIELAYQCTNQMIPGRDVKTAAPVWYIRLRNRTDDRLTVFYVDVSTGKISRRIGN